MNQKNSLDLNAYLKNNCYLQQVLQAKRNREELLI
jgi:hypothetical protein